MWARMWRKGNCLTLLVGMQTGAAALGNSMEVPQKVKNRASSQPSNYTTRYLSKGYKHSDLKRYFHPNVYSSDVHNSQDMERAQMSTDRWMDKDVVYIYRIWLSHQKKWNLTICNNVDGAEGIMLSKISQSERDRQISWFHLYVEFKKQNRGT